MIVCYDKKFNAIEKNVMWFLFNRENHKTDREDVDVIADAINVDKALCALTVAKLMNEGYAARIVSVDGRETYVLSLLGFEYMYGINLEE